MVAQALPVAASAGLRWTRRRATVPWRRAAFQATPTPVECAAYRADSEAAAGVVRTESGRAGARAARVWPESECRAEPRGGTSG